MPARLAITVVTACLNAAGQSDFALMTVEATQDQIDDGDHFSAVESQLADRGYGGPFVHFDEDDAPDFLLPAVRQYLEG
jgi:hypothetical protein